MDKQRIRNKTKKGEKKKKLKYTPQNMPADSEEKERHAKIIGSKRKKEVRGGEGRADEGQK